MGVKRPSQRTPCDAHDASKAQADSDMTKRLKMRMFHLPWLGMGLSGDSFAGA
jgi:hypothetical protein